MLSIGINRSPCAQLMGAEAPLHNLHEKAFFYGMSASGADEEMKDSNYPSSSLFEQWNSAVGQITELKFWEHIAPCY